MRTQLNETQLDLPLFYLRFMKTKELSRELKISELQQVTLTCEQKLQQQFQLLNKSSREIRKFFLILMIRSKVVTKLSPTMRQQLRNRMTRFSQDRQILCMAKCHPKREPLNPMRDRKLWKEPKNLLYWLQ